MEKLIFLDTETTGLSNSDRLMQIAYCIPEEGAVIEIIESHFKPEVPMTIEATVVNHVTDKMLEDKQPFQESEMYEFLKSALDEHILIAHNAKFDIGMLEREGLEVPKHICTYKVAKRLIDSPKHQLQYLRYYLPLDVEGGAHTAGGDVRVLMELYRHLLSMTSLDDMLEISEQY